MRRGYLYFVFIVFIPLACALRKAFGKRIWIAIRGYKAFGTGF
jgi:hypothetical protein